MGWWSATIMGGDTPLDAEGCLYNTCGLTFEDYFEGGKTPEEVNEAVSSNVAKMIDAVGANDDDWHPGVYAQVLGVIVMRHGCNPEDEDVKRALKVAKKGAEADDWEDEERHAYIKSYINQLENYDGTPQEPKSEGLFEKLLSTMS